MPKHKTISGHIIEYPKPDSKVAEIIARLQKMVDDRDVNEDEMIELAYSSENPLLGPHVVPTKGAVTRHTLRERAWHVMLDLIAQKHVIENDIDINDWAAEHTIAISEAAKFLDATPKTVTDAIEGCRLPAWLKEDGRYYLSRRALDAYRKENVGPSVDRPRKRADGEERTKPAEPPTDPRSLKVRFGNKDGVSFRLKVPEGSLTIERKDGPTINEGTVRNWKRIGVISGKPGEYLFRELVPATKEAKPFSHEGFFVKGRFKFADKANKSEPARDQFRDFVPE